MKIPFFSKFFELSNEDSLKLISSKDDRWTSIKLGVSSFLGLINPNKIEDKQSLLDLAISKGNPTSIKWLAKQGVDLNIKDHLTGRTALHVAVAKENPDMVAILLDKGADPNIKDYRGRTALHVAVAKKNSGMVAILLDKGTDPNIKDIENGDLMSLAIQKNDAKIIELLAANQKPHGEINLNQGIVVLNDELQNTNLHRALNRGYTQLAKSILRNETNLEKINLQNAEGQTALHIAAQKGNKEIIEILLNKKADLSIKDHQDKTPLDYTDAKRIKVLRKETTGISQEGYGHGHYKVKGNIRVGDHRRMQRVRER